MNRYREQVIETLRGVISYNTVLDTTNATEDAPFGLKTKECLEYMLGKAKELGFRTKQMPKYGYAEYGEGEELILILAHLDIVPLGDLNEWNSDPLTLTDDGVYFYGRGVSDDKGPAVLSLYAVKALIDDGVKFNKRVRILFGLNEETGMECVKDYVARGEELPTYGYTPDSEFPVCYGEKGIMGLLLHTKNTNPLIKSITGGMVSNAVAASARVELVKDEALKEKINVPFTETEDSYIIDFVGKSAHAMCPFEGINAINMAMRFLAEDLGFNDQFIVDYNNYIATTNASELGAAAEDEYGDLTFNIGIIRQGRTSDELELTVDIRYPITMEGKDIYASMEEGFKKTCYEVSMTHDKAGIYFPLDSTLINVCLEGYQKVTGDYESKPYTTGGGTYARSMPNLVAIGGAMPGENEYIHAPNERGKIENFFKEGEIHMEIIKRLLEI